MADEDFLELAHALRDRDDERFNLEQQLQDSRSLLDQAQLANHELKETEDALQARLDAQTKEKDHMLRQVEWLQQAWSEKERESAQLHEELGKIRRRLPGLEASWPRLGRTAAAAGAAGIASSEIRRLLADTPIPARDASCSTNSVVAFLPCVVWSVSFCLLLDIVAGPSYASQFHWVVFVMAHASAVAALGVQRCITSATGARQRVVPQAPPSSSSEGETARLLDSSRDEGATDVQTKRTSPLLEAAPERRWRHWQLPGAILTLQHVAYLAEFSLTYPGWCLIVPLRTHHSGNSSAAPNAINETDTILGGGLVCADVQGGTQDVGGTPGRPWVADAATWLAAVMPALWAIAWLGPVRDVCIAATGRFLKIAVSIEQCSRRWIAKVATAEADSAAPEPLPEMLSPHNLRRLKSRAAAVARSWRGLHRVAAVLAVDAFDCCDVWQACAMGEQFVAASISNGRNASAYFLYTNDPAPSLETISGLQISGLCVALINLFLLAPLLYLRELCSGGDRLAQHPRSRRRQESLATAGRHELFLQYMRGAVGVPPRNNWVAADALRAIVLVDTPLLAWRILAAGLTRVGPSVLVVKNVVCQLCHAGTLIRFLSWRWKLRALRARHRAAVEALDDGGTEALAWLLREYGHSGESKETSLLRGPLEEFLALYSEEVGGAWDPISPPAISAKVASDFTRGGLNDLLAARLLATDSGNFGSADGHESESGYSDMDTTSAADEDNDSSE